MFSAWNVGINLRTFSNFSLVAANISRQAAMTERSVGGLRTKISGVGTSATEASSRISGMGYAANIAGRAFIGLGVVAAAGLAHGIRGAANLQSATLQAAVGVGRLGSSLDDVEDERLSRIRNVDVDNDGTVGRGFDGRPRSNGDGRPFGKTNRKRIPADRAVY